MDRYPNDPHEQDGPDSASFLGGSVEQKDAWLSERGHVRNTPAQNADFWMAYQTAAVKHNAPDADLIAWAVPLTTGRVFASRDIFAGYLTKEHRALLGRPLLDSERRALWRVSAELWAALRTAGAAA